MEEYKIAIEIGGLTAYGSMFKRSTMGTGNIFLERERRVICLFDSRTHRLKYVKEFDGTKYYTLVEVE